MTRTRIASALAVSALLALVMAACNAPTDAQPSVDLAPIEEALARVEGKVDALAAQVEQVSAGIVDLNTTMAGEFESVATDFANLQDAALDLQALVSAPIDLSRVDLASAQGYSLTVSPPDLTVEISPGACPEGTEPPRSTRPADSLALTTYHPAPSGPHCLSVAETDATFAAGLTFEVPDGAIATLALYPRRK